MKDTHVIPFPAADETINFNLRQGPAGLARALAVVKSKGSLSQKQAAVKAAKVLLPLVTEGVCIEVRVALDTTGSMIEDLPHICAALPPLLTSLTNQAVKVNLRIGLLTFKDLSIGEAMTAYPSLMTPDEFAAALAGLSGGGGGGHDMETSLEAVMALLGDQRVLSQSRWFTNSARPPALLPLTQLSRRVLLLITDERAWEAQAQDRPETGWEPSLTRAQVRWRLTQLRFLVGLAVEKSLPHHREFWKELLTQGDIMVDIRGDLLGLKALFQTVIPRTVEEVTEEVVTEATQLLLPPPSRSTGPGPIVINL